MLLCVVALKDEGRRFKEETLLPFRQTNRRRRSRRDQARDACRKIYDLCARIVPFAFLALVALGLPYLIFQAYLHTVSSSYFALQDLEVHGAVHVDAELLLSHAELVEGMNVFEVDARRVQVLMEQHPFVKSAHVERRLPNRVVVSLEEHVAIAVLVDEGYVLVDSDAVGFKIADHDDHLEELLRLPIVTGLKRDDLETERGRRLMREALELVHLYETQGLQRLQPLSQVHLDPVMGFALVIDDSGTEIRLGWGRFEERIERLKAVQASLIERGMDVDYVLIDQDEDLSRVAVGRRLEPGNGERVSAEKQ